MRAIRSYGNKTTELRLKAILHQHAIGGWTLHDNTVLGTPDFHFRNDRVALFVDGCFWHGCPKCGHIPRTNRAYWRTKLSRNRRRDARITRQLQRLGFSVVRLWECDLRRYPSTCLRRIERALNKGQARR